MQSYEVQVELKAPQLEVMHGFLPTHREHLLYDGLETRHKQESCLDGVR